MIDDVDNDSFSRALAHYRAERDRRRRDRLELVVTLVCMLAAVMLLVGLGLVMGSP